MIGAVIQARMASTRLPGKVLMEVNGKPLLEYLIERVSHCKNIDIVVIATTVNKTDDPIEALANSHGIGCYRGSEDDVLDRFVQTARIFELDTIVRITADCPLFDPSICHRLIDIIKERKSDYVITGRTFCEGLDCEVITREALEKAHKEATLMSEREHVTPYIWKNEGLFTCIRVENDTDDGRYRFTVDEENDYLVVKAIIEYLYDPDAPIFHADEIKSFLDENQDIFRLNSHILRNEGYQKSLEKDVEE